MTGYELIKELSDIFKSADELGVEGRLAEHFSKTILSDDISKIAQSSAAVSTLMSLREEMKEISAQYVKTEAEVLCDTVRSIINNEFSNPNISLVWVGKRLGLSAGYLSALLKKTTGENFKKLLIERRMNEAAKLLKTTDMKVFEIADECGFSDVHYFSNSFKQFYSVSPKEYKFLHKY